MNLEREHCKWAWHLHYNVWVPGEAPISPRQLAWLMGRLSSEDDHSFCHRGQWRLSRGCLFSWQAEIGQRTEDLLLQPLLPANPRAQLILGSATLGTCLLRLPLEKPHRASHGCVSLCLQLLRRLLISQGVFLQSGVEEPKKRGPRAALGWGPKAWAPLTVQH